MKDTSHVVFHKNDSTLNWTVPWSMIPRFNFDNYKKYWNNGKEERFILEICEKEPPYLTISTFGLAFLELALSSGITRSCFDIPCN